MKLEYCVKNNRVRSHIAKQHGDRSAAIHMYSGPLHGVDDNPLSVYSDATLSGPVDQQCKATSGLTIFHLFHLIAWMAKLQPFTVASSHNAELLALALAADEAMWIRKTITELWFCYPEFVSPDHTHPPAICDVSENEGIVDGINHFDIALADGSVMRADLVQQSIAQHSKTNNAPWYDSWSWNNIFKSTTMMIDNLGVQFSAQNPDTNKHGSRHLDMRLFKIRDYVKARCLRIMHVATQCNIADMFTKSLPRQPFWKFISLFMVCPDKT